MDDFIVDAVLILIFAAITFVNYRKGFILSVMRLVSWVLSFVFSRFMAKPVTEWIMTNTSLFKNSNPFIAKMAMFVLLFAVFGIVLRLVIRLINRIFKLPLLKQINKLLGLVTGLLCGTLITVVLCVCLQIGSNVIYSEQFKTAVDNSRIVQLVISNETVFENMANSVVASAQQKISEG